MTGGERRFNENCFRCITYSTKAKLQKAVLILNKQNVFLMANKFSKFIKLFACECRSKQGGTGKQGEAVLCTRYPD